MIKNILIFIFVLFLAASCSSEAPPQSNLSYKDLAATPRSASIDPNASELFIYRPAQDTGRAVAPTVEIGGKTIFDIANGCFTKIYISAGHYHIHSQNALTSFLTVPLAQVLSGEANKRDRDFDIEPGKRYYLLLDQLYQTSSNMTVSGTIAVPTESFVTLRDQWTFLNESDARDAIARCAYIPPQTAFISPQSP